ncbi:MAG: phosphate acyltransferase PlsX [Angelakisella sp.]|nr:phosphate acyltransferase PlsX [Angelakisella sp.]
MKIIVDAFGGDNAPLEVLKGSAQAVKELGAQLILTGDKEKILACSQENKIDMTGIEIEDAPLVIPVEEDPMKLLKKYYDSSMGKGFQLLAEGKGDALVSAGSSGAVVAGACFITKRIKGIKRTAIATVIPNDTGCYLLLDAGANKECRPEVLRQFAVMGSAYMSKLYGIKNPRVGLVNIGTEDSKGTDLQIEANKLLKTTSGINYIGNVEAREIPLGGCDVAVCDGFTGNIVLKLTEGLAKMFSHQLKDMMMASLSTKVAAILLSGGIKEFKRKLDYKEHGGAMLLGARKPVIKAHGSSDAKAFKNAIRQAMNCAKNNVVEEIETGLKAIQDEE